MFSELEKETLIEYFKQPLRLNALREKSQIIMSKTRYKIPSNFMRAIQDEQIVLTHSLTSKNNRRVTLYSSQSPENITLYETARAMFPSGYFCNLSAVYYQALTNQVPKTVYISTESNAMKTRKNPTLTDRKLRQAFLKPNRHTRFIFNTPKGDLVVIERSKHTDHGVVLAKSSTGLLPSDSRASSVERALIDAVICPQYNGGISSIPDYFRHAKGRVNIDKLIDIYRELDFVYPYSQAIGFFLERTGMPKMADKVQDAFASQAKFYIDHNAKTSWKLDPRWRVYYPEGLVDEY